jgi:hypothetical protein
MDWEEYVTNLWTERLVWVRQLILSIMLSLRDLNFVAQRVQRNDAELGQILGSIYGPEAGQQFGDLLGEYIRILSEIAATIKAGNDTDLLMQRWAGSAEEIAEFLSQLNPYWEKSVVASLINDEMKLEFNFASELKKEQYEQGISDFDTAYDRALQAAQLMVYGVKMQLGL